MNVTAFIIVFPVMLLCCRENPANEKTAWFSRRIPVSLAVDLMIDSSVGHEIGISSEQIEPLKALRKRYLAEVLRESRKMKSQSPDANTTSTEDRIRGFEKVENDFRIELLALLSESQRQRFQQIVWQMEPAHFLLNGLDRRARSTKPRSVMGMTEDYRLQPIGIYTFRRVW